MAQSERAPGRGPAPRIPYDTSQDPPGTPPDPPRVERRRDGDRRIQGDRRQTGDRRGATGNGRGGNGHADNGHSGDTGNRPNPADGAERPVSPVSGPAPGYGVDPYETEVELLDYVEVLVRWRWLVIGLALVCAVAAGLMALQKPLMFEAQAVLLPDRRPDFAQLGPGAEVGNPSAGVYVDMLASLPVRRALLQREFTYLADGGSVTSSLTDYFRAPTRQGALGALAGALEIAAGRNGGITVTGRFPEPQLAAAVPNALIRELMDQDQARRTRHVAEQVAFIEQRVNEVQTELSTAEEALAQFRRSNRDLALAESGQAMGNPDLVAEHSRLQREVSLRSSLLSTLLNQHEVARLEAKKDFPRLEVLAWAETPELPQGRGTVKHVLLGGIVGLMGAVMLAFLLEYGRRNAATGRMEPILEPLRRDGDRVRRLLGRSSTAPRA